MFPHVLQKEELLTKIYLYRYGDDFKGNVEIMALTVCPDALWFYKFIEGTQYGQGQFE